MSETRINWKGILFYGVIFAAAVLVALYFYGGTGENFATPVNGFFNSLGGSITSYLGGINFGGIFEWIQNNPIMSGVIATLGTTAITYVIKNWQTNKLLDKTVNDYNETKTELSLTQQEVGKVSTKLTNAEKELEMYANDTTAQQLQNALSQKMSEFEQKEAKYLGQIEELQKQPANIAESLWCKSGGQTIEINGEKYKIIEKTETVVK